MWPSETHWPSQPILRGDDTFDTEVKKCAVLPLSTVSRKLNFFDSQCSRCSSWKKLLRVSAIILRYKKLFSSFLTSRRNPINEQASSQLTILLNPLSVAEMFKAENLLFSYLQQKFFSDEFEALKGDNIIRTLKSTPQTEPVPQGEPASSWW